MATSPTGFVFNGRKVCIYGTILAGFIILCLGYLFLVNVSAQSAAERTIDNWIGNAKEQVRLSVESQIKEFRLLLLEDRLAERLAGLTREQVDGGGLATILQGLEQNHPGYRFYFLGPGGVLYDRDGKPRARNVNRSALRRSEKDGVTLTEFYDPGGGQREVAEVIPILSGSNRYLIRTSDIAVYARELLNDLALIGDYIAFFDSETRVTAGKAQTDAGKSESIHDAVAAGAARFFLESKLQDVHRIDWIHNYNVFILMDEHEGWIFAAHITASQLLPFYSDMLTSSLAVFVVMLALILIVIVLDIFNDRKKNIEVYLARSLDTLTRLNNELGVQNAIKEHLKTGDASGESLVAFDIVAFGRYNAMFGYAAGDRLLRIVAGVLREYYRFGARISADLFMCLAKTAPGLLDVLDDRLRLAVRNELGKQHLKFVEFKYGAYDLTDRGHSFGEVYDSCMLALRQAKKTTGRKAVVFDNQLQAKAELQKKIEMNMLHALSREEFVPYVQPKYDALRDMCAGGEALVRWFSGDHGIITPDHFIPLFERNGFIVELDFYMLAAVFDTMQRELECGVAPLPISVNQSRVTISFPNYLERIGKLVNRFSAPTNLVELEITESGMEDRIDETITLMHSLKEMGFTIAMDDFGSGFSSLNTLRELPVDVLKLDRNFLRQSDNSSRSRKIVRNVINLAKDLGISVICEGVETQAQLDFLMKSGCNLIQGYFYSRPIPYNEFEKTYLTWPEMVEGA